MSARLRLLLADSRRRPGRVVGAVVTCVITAVVVGASGLLLADLLAWRPAAPSHFDRAAAVVVARLADGTRGGVVPEETSEAVAGAAGVGRVVGYRDRWLSVCDGDTAIVGPDEQPTRAWNWSAAAALGYRPVPPAGPTGNDIVIDARIAERLSVGVGDDVTTVSAAGPRSRRVAGVVTAPSGSALVLLLADAELARQPGSAAPTSLLVFAERGHSAKATRDALARRLDGQRFEVVAPGRYRPGPADPVTAQVTGGSDLLSFLLFVLLASAGVVLGTTLSLWIGQRLAQLTVLRALGVSAPRVWGLVLADVGTLAVPSALVGAVIGAPLVARAARRELLDSGLLPAGTPEATASPRTILVLAGVVIATVLIALVAALSAARSAASVDPASVLGSPGVPARLRRGLPRLIIGASLLGMGLIPLVATIALGMGPLFVGAASTGAAILIVPALALLSPWLVTLLAPAAGGLIRVVDRRIGRLAGANLRASSVRTAALAGPALIGVGLTTVLLGAPRTIDAETREQTGERVTAEHVTVADGARALPLTGLGQGSATAPAGGSTGIVATIVVPPKDPNSDVTNIVDAAGVDGRAIAAVLELDVRAGDLSKLGGEAFAAGTATMSQYGWSVGQRVRLQLADGQWRTLRLVASYGRDLGFAGVLLPRELAVAHDPDPGTALVLADGPAVDGPAVDGSAVDGSAVDGSAPGRRVLERAEFLAEQRPRSAADNLATLLITLVIAGYALLSLANTAALAQADQGAHRATLRMIGGGRRQLARLITWEALGGVAIGTLLGLAVAVVGLVPLSLAIGHGPLPVFDPLWTLVVPLMCALAGVLPALLAGRPLRRVDRVTATR